MVRLTSTDGVDDQNGGDKMNEEITKVQRRATQSQFVDGSFEFKMGLEALVLAANTAIPPKGFAGIFGLLASLVLIGAGGWLINRLIRLFKERLTLQRSGLASPPGKKEPSYPPDTILYFVVLGFLAWIFLISWAEAVLGNNMVPLLAGLILFVVLLVMAVRSGVKRFYLLAGISLGAGIILALVNHGQWSLELIGIIYFCLMAVVFLFSGGVTLRNFLSNTPPMEELGFGK
jgi:hypothetical protein